LSFLAAHNIFKTTREGRDLQTAALHLRRRRRRRRAGREEGSRT